MLALVAAIFVSGGFAMQLQNGYKAQAEKQNEMKPYKPIMPEAAEPEDVVAQEAEKVHVNQGIVDLKEEYVDAVGWITIPHTGVDHPFVQAGDNDYYVRKDMDGNFAMAGTIFMDCQSAGDFSGFNMILYGHHMRNGTMFASLAQYYDEEFFKTNTKGTIFLADKTLSLDFFAFIIVKEDDTVVYGDPSDEGARDAMLEYISENAMNYREIGVDTDDHLVTLSSCTREFNDYRMLLIGRATRIQ